ncbi:hypothetical protein [Accumulibacter sp.]|uniref:hypothetical protein n=1 Tax=Accumulibacter sp. TaxID=2053492 RepID=UPI002B77A9A0|nr:hypothetical protein [Accumulibacter sp.]HRF05240.1 hypothetical protein [Accumulibacter sp.]
MSLKESIVEDVAPERFAAQLREFKEAAIKFSRTLATVRATLLLKLPSGELSVAATSSSLEGFA